MDWIIENKEWLFSGVAVAIIGWIINLFISKKGKSQKQESGDNSTNIQVGGNFSIGSKDDR